MIAARPGHIHRKSYLVAHRQEIGSDCVRNRAESRPQGGTACIEIGALPRSTISRDKMRNGFSRWERHRCVDAHRPAHGRRPGALQ